MLANYAKAGIVNTAIAMKVNIADTAAMLTNYAKAGIVNGAIALKVNIADTAAMLANYTRQALLDGSLALKAPLASPALTGSPTAPTANALDNSTKIATTEYVDRAVSSVLIPAISSDARLKKDVTPVANGIKTVMQLNPVKYEKKAALSSNDYSIKEIGFIAQELQKVLPLVVTETKDADKILKVNYISVIPVLTKAIQEQQQQIEAQQKQIDELKSMLQQVLNKKQ
jgi:hypothetical protein